MKKALCMILTVMIVALLLTGCDLGSVIGAGRQVSASDAETAQEAQWQPAATDEEYSVLAQDKLDVFIEYFTQLSAESERLSGLGSRKKVLADEKFTEISENLTAWCDGAEAYSASSLSEETSKEICGTASQLGGLTKEYLAVYPDMVSGSYSGEMTAEDYENEIVDLAVSLFELLNQ